MMVIIMIIDSAMQIEKMPTCRPIKRSTNSFVADDDKNGKT